MPLLKEAATPVAAVNPLHSKGTPVMHQVATMLTKMGAGSLPHCQAIWEQSLLPEKDDKGTGLSQGEEEVDDTLDEMVIPGVATTRCGTWVAEQDCKEHLLVAGKWFSLRVV